jgi:hypothetical protein
MSAYLARFKGISREHTGSDLNTFVTWCTERGVQPLAARRADLELFVRWMQETRRFKPSTVARRTSVVAGFYRTCVIDGVLDHSPAEYVRRPSVPPESPTLGLTHLQFEAMLTLAAGPPRDLCIAFDAYSIKCMARYVVEIEPEVRQWLDSLSDHDYGRAEFYADLLADNAETLGEPYSRHLGGKVRELRFHLQRQQVRITYWLASGRRVILLTVFNKTQRSEVAEVDRALAVQKECEAEHGHAVDVYDRRNSDE